ncbi:calcium-activated potassium channel subunit beta-1 isoform X3 [Ovis aries]|uniref:calcium-activated potassium channel subunit beta-1 isoform X3 n=1 Tax=Ovis aries TaxID=9940 RepID=UPI00072F7852|nr:calcium-activated potassium channel subunit beta-1 isoform X3 [Ovis aries]
MGKKLVMAQKRGETRALCLGVAMVVGAVITYYILGTTVLPLYQKSVWTQESTCHLIETNIRDQEELEGKRVPQYPCLWVNVSSVGRWAVLYHTEDTRDQNHQGLLIYPQDQEANFQRQTEVVTGAMGVGSCQLRGARGQILPRLGSQQPEACLLGSEGQHSHHHMFSLFSQSTQAPQEWC